MSTHPSRRRRHVQRLGLAGIGGAVLLVGIATPAGAATDVVVPLAPTEVALSAYPVDDLGATDPMADPTSVPATPVRFGGTLVVELPAELDSTDVQVDLVFDDNGDQIPEATHSSAFAPAHPEHLPVTGQGTSTITVTLPADDPAVGDDAVLTLQPLTSTLGPEFTFYDPVYYELGFDAGAPATATVEPALVAYSSLPCGFSTWTWCPFPTPVTAGSAVGLELPGDSLLREVGQTDLAGIEVDLAPVDEDGFQTAAGEPLTAEVSGATASVVVPATTEPGTYTLTVVQQAPTGRVFVAEIGLTVVAEAVPEEPAAETPAAAPTTQAVVNAGLRSNTGVVAPVAADDVTGSTGAVAAGAGLLLLAGAGGVVVRRRRAAAGTGEA